MNNKPTTIVWFRNDLRLSDNPALHYAAQSGAVLCVYLWAPEEEGNWPPGAANRWWIHRHLEILDKKIKSQGGQLILRVGNTAKALREIAEEVDAKQIFCNRRYEPAIRQRDEALSKELGNQGIKLEVHSGSLLCEPWEVRTGSGGPYQVYTPFSKNYQQNFTCRQRFPDPAPSAFYGRKLKSASLADLGLLDSIPWWRKLETYYEPGETAALKRLASFNEIIRSYGKNRDIPGVAGTSELSAYLQIGAISPHTVWRSAIRQEGDRRRIWSFLRQLVWREFAYHLLYHFPHTTDKPLRKEFNQFPWRKSEAALRKWQEGKTGYAIVDAGMRQLWETGWMHNRVRMVSASLLVKHLRMHWINGSKWFWDTLVDADLANNTMGWQWVAGCGADAAPFFRIFNPYLQEQRFDPSGEYRRHWLDDSDLAREPVVDHQRARAEALAAYEKVKK